MQTQFVEDFINILICPKCNNELHPYKQKLSCWNCGQTYTCEGDIPRMFFNTEGNDSRDVTEIIKSFYEETPFPNYDDFDDIAGLIKKSKRGIFANLLDEQIPFGSRILECGCGTGQLSNFLAIANRTVIGTDMCLNSLKLAHEFKMKNELTRVHFAQMNLFSPFFKPASFDWVISNGVLHHTSKPFDAFKSISRLVKPGGYIIIGLYHKYGRIFTDIRRFIFNLTHDRLQFLDKRLVTTTLSMAKKNAWFKDQYKNPHESKHTINEVMGWLDITGFSFVKSIPKNRIGEQLLENENLIEPDEIGNRLERFLKEFGMIFTNYKEGGLFIVIGKKNLRK